MFVVYYKPRDAHIDAAIINLFKEINRLSHIQKSLTVPLPEYKILSVATNLEVFSIWEYIDVKNDEKPSSGEANIVIDTLVSQKKINPS